MKFRIQESGARRQKESRHGEEGTRSSPRPKGQSPKEKQTRSRGDTGESGKGRGDEEQPKAQRPKSKGQADAEPRGHGGKRTGTRRRGEKTDVETGSTIIVDR